MRGSHLVAQAGFEDSVLPQLPKCWGNLSHGALLETLGFITVGNLDPYSVGWLVGNGIK